MRECARQSVVELFTGPGVTDAARADLKKEMTKKGVRKTIADSVLARVLAGGASTPGPASEGGSSEGDHGGSAAAHKESGLQAGGKFASVALDVGDKTQVASFLERVPADLRQIDILGADRPCPA